MSIGDRSKKHSDVCGEPSPRVVVVQKLPEAMRLLGGGRETESRIF